MSFARRFLSENCTYELHEIVAGQICEEWRCWVRYINRLLFWSLVPQHTSSLMYLEN
jgi:hypothetical protein